MVALFLAGLATTAMGARPAHAGGGGPSVSAYGGPAQVFVTGSGFNSGASVRVVVLSDPSLNSVAPAVYTNANSSGFINVNVTGMTYTGSVYVLVDSAAFPTVGAVTTVQPPPQWITVGQQQCFYSYPVIVSAAGFAQYYDVRFEVLPDDLSRVLDTKYATSDRIGDAYAQLSTSGYHGWVYVVADEIGYGPTGFIPFPYSLWNHVYVC
jgi:hypothetical protein